MPNISRCVVKRVRKANCVEKLQLLTSVEREMRFLVGLL